MAELIRIGKRKAKRLGISEERRRKGFTRSALTRFETKSGQYTVSPTGKTTLIRETEEQEIAPTIEREPQIRPTIHLTPKPEERLSAREQALQEHPALTRGLETAAITLGAVAAGLGAYALLVPTGIVINEIGTRVGSILHTASIHHWSKSTGLLVAKKGITLSRVPILEKAGKIGASGVDKLFKAGVNVAVNPKTTALATSVVSKHFGIKAVALFGTWASSVFLGKWAQAEAAEPITIPLRDALRQAQETGDWTIYDEYVESAREIANPTTWRTIISFSPISAIPGILNKMKGVQKGIELIDKIAEKEKARVAKPTFAEERETADVEARGRELEERKEDTAFFEKQKGESRRSELEERQRDALYFELIRQKKYEEAAELLEEELK